MFIDYLDIFFCDLPVCVFACFYIEDIGICPFLINLKSLYIKDINNFMVAYCWKHTACLFAF